jgi:predicted nucleic acid-binding protein
MSPSRPVYRRGAGARKRVREQAAVPPLPLVYVESSALVAAWLESDEWAKRALNSPGRLVTSAITFTEARRAVLRARVAGRITAAQAASALDGLIRQSAQCQVVAVSEDVLARAGQAFPVEPVRTLDAIHLASMELLGVAPHFLSVVTRDARVADNARALGYAVSA